MYPCKLYFYDFFSGVSSFNRYCVVRYIDRVPNRKSPPAILIRESYRENGRVRKRTLANLSKLPAYAIEALEAAFQGGTVLSFDRLRESLKITRTWQHGHVAAALGSLHRCELEPLIVSQRSRNRNLVTAMIVARLLDPR